MKSKLINIVVKFLLTFAAAWFSFGYIGGNTLGWIALTSIVVTIFNYFIGDFIILPSLGNIVSSIVDGLLSALMAFIISLLFKGSGPNNQIVNIFKTNLLTLAFFAVVMGIIEYLFHKYLFKPDKISFKKDYHK